VPVIGNVDESTGCRDSIGVRVDTYWIKQHFPNGH
jgi:hypothetical protein